MEVDPETFQENLLKFLGESPTFELGQKQRYIYFHDLGRKLEKLKTVFANYRVTYGSLQQKLVDIEDALSSVSEFGTAMRGCRFQEVATGLKDSIDVYLKVFDDHILNPVNDFIKSIEDMEYLNTVAEENHNNFEDAFDKFMQETNQNSKGFLTKQTNLVDAHKYASSTFVNLYNKLEEITVNMKTLPSLIIAGIIESHNQQADFINKILIKNNNNMVKHDALLEVIKADKQKQKTDAQKLETSICGILPNYWNRFSTPFKGTTKLTIQGWLYKRGKHFNNWQRRFVTVANGFLSYGQTVDEYMRDPTTINLVLSSVRYEKDLNRPNCFSITSQDEVRVFECVSQYDLDKWISIIESNIISAINNNGSQKRTENQVAHHKTAMPSTKPMHSLRFECADCKACDATWITLNWCQHLCSKCGGVHRSLGPVVSRVRSIALDTIIPWPLRVFDALQTQPTNEFLEYRADDGEKINASTTPEKREEFIRKKYVELAFADNRLKAYTIFDSIAEHDLFKVFKCIASGDLKLYNDHLPIHAAAIEGDPLILTLIAMNTPNLDEQDMCGWTALTYAVYYGNSDCVDSLLELGANPNAAATAPLWLAARSGQSKQMVEKFPQPQEKQENVENVVPMYGPDAPQCKVQAGRRRFLTDFDIAPMPTPGRQVKKPDRSTSDALKEFARRRRHSYNQTIEDSDSD